MRLGRICLVLAVAIGCSDHIGKYRAAASLTRSGFAIDAGEIRRLDGRTVNIWGYVDHANMLATMVSRRSSGSGGAAMGQPQTAGDST